MTPLKGPFTGGSTLSHISQFQFKIFKNSTLLLLLLLLQSIFRLSNIVSNLIHHTIQMRTFLFFRFFLLYNLLHSFLLYLVPKKLRLFLPTSWYSPPPLPPPSPSPLPPPSSPSPPPPSSSTPPTRMDSAELKRVFQMFDRNGDGRITKKELSDSLDNLGIMIPDNELSQMIERVDVNGDGCVDIDEFGALYNSIMDGREEEEEDVKEAFNVFDQNGDGFITVEELKSVLGSLGLKQGRTAEDCKKMIMKVDEDGDGMVDFKEFKQMMKNGVGFSGLS